MSFRKLRGVPLPYEKQGLIYFTCRNFEHQPKHIQDKIERLCRQCGGEYCAALFELLTTDATVPAVAMRHFLSEDALSRLRKGFYCSW